MTQPAHTNDRHTSRQALRLLGLRRHVPYGDHTPPAQQIEHIAYFVVHLVPATSAVSFNDLTARTLRTSAERLVQLTPMAQMDHLEQEYSAQLTAQQDLPWNQVTQNLKRAMNFTARAYGFVAHAPDDETRQTASAEAATYTAHALACLHELLRRTGVPIDW
ncbi:hypothetical protein [Deinococcus soli (ex Cha et al. 2016)]|uniref:Uncharacterized protein n=2 Tax=Deinococcus soli (ex Cha et al. 2016) TaxID=1309411 RepID=A0ACC6KFT8_9DEIO|nr:hypothetical protein [Deinococcus soli (ex Cha et al. 2016)]MDR6218395.1 hypothetical protein [Deinococcus soli (ex Cha et al. 2016)]MDR6329135.1 hypothetical protein [Deinococcus soli (ex Cha et al. 2016)]MDR6751408.1 hypothetical protein [Deinococcus soli (ex Cha et al. 2016)]